MRARLCCSAQEALNESTNHSESVGGRNNPDVATPIPC